MHWWTQNLYNPFLQDGTESDSSLYPDTDCEDIYGPRLSYSSSFTEDPGYLRSFEKLSCEKTIIVGQKPSASPTESQCPRCLETDHWEDECWVLAEKVATLFGILKRLSPNQVPIISPQTPVCTLIEYQGG